MQHIINAVVRTYLNVDGVGGGLFHLFALAEVTALKCPVGYIICVYTGSNASHGESAMLRVESVALVVLGWYNVCSCSHLAHVAGDNVPHGTSRDNHVDKLAVLLDCLSGVQAVLAVAALEGTKHRPEVVRHLSERAPNVVAATSRV